MMFSRRGETENLDLINLRNVARVQCRSTGGVRYEFSSGFHSSMFNRETFWRPRWPIAQQLDGLRDLQPGSLSRGTEASKSNLASLAATDSFMHENFYFLYTVGRGPFSSVSRSQIMSSRE